MSDTTKKSMIGVQAVHQDGPIGNTNQQRRKKIKEDFIKCCKMIEKIKQCKKQS